jgi:pyrroline-5-carboxylate reductase
LIGKGITGVCVGSYAKSADLELAKPLFAVMGEMMVVKESMMDSVTAVSGSGPAYVFLFVEAWMTAAKKLGFNEAEAKLLVDKTLLGSATLLNQAAWTASELRVKVTSKGGTTQAAMDVFLKGKFDQLMNKALLAAKKRSKELSK